MKGQLTRLRIFPNSPSFFNLGKYGLLFKKLFGITLKGKAI